MACCHLAGMTPPPRLSLFESVACRVILGDSGYTCDVVDMGVKKLFTHGHRCLVSNCVSTCRDLQAVENLLAQGATGDLALSDTKKRDRFRGRGVFWAEVVHFQAVRWSHKRLSGNSSFLPSFWEAQRLDLGRCAGVPAPGVEFCCSPVISPVGESYLSKRFTAVGWRPARIANFHRRCLAWERNKRAKCINKNHWVGEVTIIPWYVFTGL